MKKMLSLAGVGFVVCFSSLIADPVSLVSIDSLSIMQKSKEGTEVAAQIQKDIDKFQAEVKKAQDELASLQEALSKKAKVLSQEALQQKTEELTQKKKNHERDLSDKEEALRIEIQKKQITLRDKQMKVASDISEQEGWGLVVDKNTPGVLFVSKAIDKTDVVLKAIDEKYSDHSPKAPAKKLATVKTEKNATIQTASKDAHADKNIKVA